MADNNYHHNIILASIYYHSPPALPISVVVTANLNTPLMVGQTDNILTCVVSGADNLNPTIAYQWTRDGVTVQSGSSNTFNFSPFRLSLAGVYTCSVTVTSNLLNDAIQVPASNTQTVTIEGEFNNVISSIIVVILSYVLSQQFRIHRQLLLPVAPIALSSVDLLSL